MVEVPENTRKASRYSLKVQVFYYASVHMRSEVYNSQCRVSVCYRDIVAQRVMVSHPTCKTTQAQENQTLSLTEGKVWGRD